MTLPEEIFNSAINLELIRLNDNKLSTLSGNVFKPLNKIGLLMLENNQLTTLPGNIFHLIQTNWHNPSIFPLKGISLKSNPWTCDKDFLENIQSKLTMIMGYKEIVCNDGELLREKINRSIEQ